MEGEAKKTDQNEDDGDGWWRLYRSAMPWWEALPPARESDDRRCE